jgi:peptidoglycan/xylan/chitin deacetylase (PgdA/CDA1 family)
MTQAGPNLIVSLRTTRPIALERLQPLPSTRAPGASYLCLELSRAGGGGRRICLGGPTPHRRLGVEVTNHRGHATHKRLVRAAVERPRPRRLVVKLRPARAGLAPRRYRWRVVARGRPCRKQSCGESLPARGDWRFRLRPVRAVGCTGGGAGLVTNGPRGHGLVALTFDDGPSDYPPAFLDVLRAKHAVGTFFEVGQEIGGREATMRRALREGSEIGDHTMHHAVLPGAAEIGGAAAAIERATHFRPCLFRPPGGVISSGVIATAGSLGMLSVTWDVDPADWTNPGSGAVYGRVVGATRPGSIVLMHDGGGSRSGTLAALPGIIDSLRGRGYRFVTVSRLLGNSLIFRPYG